MVEHEAEVCQASPTSEVELTTGSSRVRMERESFVKRPKHESVSWPNVAPTACALVALFSMNCFFEALAERSGPSTMSCHQE